MCVREREREDDVLKNDGLETMMFMYVKHWMDRQMYMYCVSACVCLHMFEVESSSISLMAIDDVGGIEYHDYNHDYVL